VRASSKADPRALWLRWLHLPLALLGLPWLELDQWPRYLLVVSLLALEWPFCIRLTLDADVYMYMPVMWTSAAAAYALGPAILPVFWLASLLGFALIVVLDGAGLVPAEGIAAESARRWRGQAFDADTVADGDVRHSLNMMEHMVRVGTIGACRLAAFGLLPTVLVAESVVLAWRQLGPRTGWFPPTRTWSKIAETLGPDMPLATVLLHVVMVCFILLAGRTGGPAGFAAASLATLTLHAILKRLSDTRNESERRRAELLSTQEELDRRRRLATIGQTAATVFHQVARHHGAIGMYAHLLGRAAADDPATVRDHASRIQSSVTNANRVIDELLRFGRDRELNLYPHALATVVAECVDDCRPRADAAGVPLQAAQAPVVTLPLDKHKLKQAIGNLLDNAVMAAPPGTPVEITTAVENGQVRILVRDHGPGVAPEIRDRLFTPFATTKPDGIGLGLVLARDLVEAHGGTLDWRPAAPGTEFVVTLPHPQADASAEAGDGG
jgi:signal transduction histidine kinase